MKLFQFVQSTFEIVGVCPNHSNQKHLLNGKILLVFLCYGLSITSCCVFVLYEAENFKDYTEFIPVFSTFITSALGYVTVLLRMEALFEIIAECVDTIEKSKVIACVIQ